MKAKLSDLIPDDNNFNAGTEYGEGLIEKSFGKFGAMRSVVLDKNNRIMAGNKSTQKFAEAGGDKVLIVETTGDTLVAVKRTDLDLNTKHGREAALADNATAKANIVFDFPTLLALDVPYEEWGVVFPDFGGTDESDTGRALSDTLEYRIIVTCNNEQQQQQLLDKFTAEGLQCQVLIS